MQQCPQTETQSVYQHGVSVRNHLFELIDFLETGKIGDGWKLPDWIKNYQFQIKSCLLSKDIIETYAVFHDCGKPYCLTIDAEGKRHFPNHAQVSAQTWMRVDGDKQIAKLIEMDMIIHTIKADQLDDFVRHPEAITLLLTGLAEVHSNAKMFGGIESDSFKIKWNQINRRGKAICLKLFGDVS